MKNHKNDPDRTSANTGKKRADRKSGSGSSMSERVEKQNAGDSEALDNRSPNLNERYPQPLGHDDSDESALNEGMDLEDEEETYRSRS